MLPRTNPHLCALEICNYTLTHRQNFPTLATTPSQTSSRNENLITLVEECRKVLFNKNMNAQGEKYKKNAHLFSGFISPSNSLQDFRILVKTSFSKLDFAFII